MKVLKERFDTLSDAIIAIIMTVLVLEIKTPETVSQLPQLVESVGLFLITFVILMNFWFHRLELSYFSESESLNAFLLDVIAHAILSLYPVVVKMLIEFEVIWIGILLFGLLNISTGVLLNVMAMILIKQESESFTQAEKLFIFHIYKRRLIGVAIVDITILVIALLFNQFGIYLYIFSPFAEFLFNYKRGNRIQEFLKGQSFIQLMESKYRREK